MSSKRLKAVIDGSIYAAAPSGGAFRYLNELICGLAALSDVEVQVLLPRGAVLPSTEKTVQVAREVLPGTRWFPEGRLKRTLRLAKRFVASLQLSLRNVGSEGSVYHSANYRLPSSSKVPSVFVIHDLIGEIFPEYAATPHLVAMSELKRRCVERASRLIAISECTKRDIVKVYGFDPNRIDVIYHGVNQKEFGTKVPKEEIDRIMRLHQIERPYLLHVGGRLHHKNFGVLVEALARPELRGLDLVVTATPLTSQEHELLQRHGVASRVRCVPHAGSELVALYQGAAAFVFPSLYEGFGLPLLEAMAAGCPVAASNAGPFPEITENAAVLFDPRDARDVAVKVASLLDEKMAHQQRQLGYQRAAAFRWTDTAVQTAESLRRALST